MTKSPCNSAVITEPLASPILSSRFFTAYRFCQNGGNAQDLAFQCSDGLEECAAVPLIQVRVSFWSGGICGFGGSHLFCIGTSNDFKPLASAASPIVNFTFVNQAEDLGSLTARKITNQEQRHVIRSHVMKSVRQEELARGKKRSIGRDHGRRSDLDKAQSTSSDSDSSHKNQSPGPLTVVVKQELEESGHDLHIVGDKKTGHSGATWLTTAGSTGKMTYVPAVIEFDPFDTLPCTSLAHQGLESLLQYCE